MPPFVHLEYNIFRSKMFHLDMSKLYISIKRLNPTSWDLWLFKPPKGYDRLPHRFIGKVDFLYQRVLPIKFLFTYILNACTE